ncbi:hypothetical protein DH86_00000949, partial [Scytalidium sp. 3C]
PTSTRDNGAHIDRSPTAIVFVRNRILYAPAALNAHQEVNFGLRRVHALNRYKLKSATYAGNVAKSRTHKEPQYSTTMLTMYIFPRQFGLHNVFTSIVDASNTVQPFPDYTERESEISAKYRSTHNLPRSVKIPKRLRGKPLDLIRKLQILHKICAYKQLLEYYCPVHNGSPNSFGTLDKPQVQLTNSTTFETQLPTN